MSSEKLPSGYLETVQVDSVEIDSSKIPWLKDPMVLNISKITLESGENFLLASAISADERLIKATDGMTEHQKQITDNMFYSRLPEMVKNDYSPSIAKVPSTVTEYPVYVLKNKGGQRVYFSRIRFGIEQEELYGPTFIRLAVCDKNRQGLVMSVISSLDPRERNRRLKSE